MTTSAPGAGVATVASVPSSASSVTLLAANNGRTGATIYNDSTAILYVSCNGGTAASTSSFTVQMASETFLEIPFGYRGEVTGIWASANGAARVTEFV